MGFFVTGKRGTIRDNPKYNAAEACMTLYKGMKGIGTDEASVISVVSSHSFAQRLDIREKYYNIYKKDLLKELDSELSFTFGKLVLSLMADPEEIVLEGIQGCVVKKRLGKIAKKLSYMFNDGMRRTEYCLLSLLCPLTNDQLCEIKKSFKVKYKQDLIERIALGGNDLSVDFTTFLIEFISEEREEEDITDVNTQAIEVDTESLVTGGGDAQDAFQTMILKKSWSHLTCVFDAYSMVTGSTIETFIDSAETYSIELKEVYKAVILLITNEPVFYADRLRGAIQGAGTDDETLIRILVLRSEVDLVDIMEVYETKFGISLADDVAGDTSGDYKDLLLKVICVPPPQPTVQEREKLGVVKKLPVSKVARQNVVDDGEYVKKVQRQVLHVSGSAAAKAVVAGRKKKLAQATMAAVSAPIPEPGQGKVDESVKVAMPDPEVLSENKEALVQEHLVKETRATPECKNEVEEEHEDKQECKNEVEEEHEDKQECKNEVEEEDEDKQECKNEVEDGVDKQECKELSKENDDEGTAVAVANDGEPSTVDTGKEVNLDQDVVAG